MSNSSVPIPFDLTNRDYEAIRTQLISYVQTRLPGWNPSNASDFGVVLLEAFALIGDNLSYYLDRIANESSILTATQPDSVFNLARQLGYEPALPTPANVTVQFTNGNVAGDTLPAYTPMVATAVINGVSTKIPFETTSSLYLPGTAGPGLNYDSVTCLQVKTYKGVDGTGEILGVSDGSSNQSFPLGKTRVAQGSVRVIVNDGSADVEWQEVTNLYDYGPGDYVFQVHANPNTSAYILFGNGANGSIPTANATIKSIFQTTYGSIGNIANNTLSFDGVPRTGWSLSQSSAAYAGGDAEPLSSIRQNAPASFYAQRRAVTASDYEAIALSLPQVSKASADVSLWSNPVVYCAPPDDGTYTPGQLLAGVWTGAQYGYLQSAQTQLQNAAMAGTTVSVSIPTYVAVALNVTCYLDARTSQSKAELAVLSAIRNLFAFSNQDFGGTLNVHDVLFAISQIKSDLLVSVSRQAPVWPEGGGGGILNRKSRNAGPQSTARGVSGVGHVNYADVTAMYRKDAFSSGLHVPTTAAKYEIFYLDTTSTSRNLVSGTYPLSTITYQDLTINLSGGVFDLA